MNTWTRTLTAALLSGAAALTGAGPAAAGPDDRDDRDDGTQTSTMLTTIQNLGIRSEHAYAAGFAYSASAERGLGYPTADEYATGTR